MSKSKINSQLSFGPLSSKEPKNALQYLMQNAKECTNAANLLYQDRKQKPISPIMHRRSVNSANRLSSFQEIKQNFKSQLRGSMEQEQEEEKNQPNADFAEGDENYSQENHNLFDGLQDSLSIIHARQQTARSFENEEFLE